MNKEYTSTEQKLLKKIGENIRTLRKQNDISQEGLALECDLDRAYLGSVERGERNISIINLKKIADALNVELHLFFK